MIFTADRKKLWEAAKTVSQIAGTIGSFPELSGLLIYADEATGELRITGTDTLTFIQKRLQGMHVQEGGTMVVSAQLITEILKLLPEDIVGFTFEGHNLTITSGNAVFQILTLQADKFPPIDIPFPEDTIRIAGLSSLVRNTVFASSDQESRLDMQSVKISFSGGSTTATATDGYRMVLTQSYHCADGMLEMLIHKKALGVLCNIINSSDELYVGISGKSVVLFNQKLIFSTRLMERKFIDISQVIESVNKNYYARMDATELYQAIDSASACLQNDDDQCINLLIENDKIIVSAVSMCGTSRSNINAQECIPTPFDGFHYRPQLLADYLRRASGPLEIIIDNRGFLLLNANNRKYAVSPRGPVKVRKKKSIPGKNLKKQKRQKNRQEQKRLLRKDGGYLC